MSRCKCHRIVVLLFGAFLVVSLINLYAGWVILDQMDKIRWLSQLLAP